MNLTLKLCVENIDKLECKIWQASLLAYPDFVTFKGFEICLDMSRVRFGLTLNVHTPILSKDIFAGINRDIKKGFISELCKRRQSQRHT